MRNKFIIILTVLVIVLSSSVVKGIKCFNKSSYCNSATSKEIAQYIFELNQKEFSFEDMSTCETKFKNVKKIKKVDNQFFCQCDLVIYMQNGDVYNKKLYYVSTKQNNNPMVMLQDESFTQKAKLIKSFNKN